MSNDEVLAAFAALPLTTQMRASKPVFERANKRLGTIHGWYPADMRTFANAWEAEDAAKAAKADREREHLVEDLAARIYEQRRILAEDVMWSRWDALGELGKDTYRSLARALFGWFDITPKEKP